MRRKSIIHLLFLVSIVVFGVFRVSAATAADVKKDKSDEDKGSPSPSPLPSLKANNSSNNSSHTDVIQPKSGNNGTNESSPQGKPVPNASSNLIKEGSGGDAHGKKKDNNQEGKNTPGISASPEESEVCNGMSGVKCADNPKTARLTACIQDSGGSQDSILLVKNEWNDTLTVNVNAPASSNISKKSFHLPKHQYEKMNLSMKAGHSLRIVLNAGNGDCILQLGVPAPSTGLPVPATDFLRLLPTYANRMTPMYGAYFLFLCTLIIGGIWACCKFGKRGRRVDGGVPYQELEMGLPPSSSAPNVDTADGWDESWDDDWEEKPARTSEIRHVGNVSANGLTSRSPNKEGWDEDWDD